MSAVQLNLETRYKRLARMLGAGFNVLTKRHKREQPVDTLLQMPSSEMRDTRMAIRYGLIHRSRTQCIFVEQDPIRYDEMAGASTTLCLRRRPQLFNCPAEQCYLPNVVQSGELDFADFDFCASPTRTIATWLRDVLSAVISSKTVLCFTFCRNFRANAFVEDFRQWLYGYGDGGGSLLAKQSKRLLRDCDWVYNTSPIASHQVTAEFMDIPLFVGHHRSVEIILSIVQGAMFHYDFDVAACLSYPAASKAIARTNGGSSMCRLRLHNFRAANYRLRWRKQQQQLDSVLYART